ncbi:MAG TPA: hypothetical protein VK178_06250, partial [Opitutaceae bacterium]|nr:hypothetical protein [Opitutaceae bacterium]
MERAGAVSRSIRISAARRSARRDKLAAVIAGYCGDTLMRRKRRLTALLVTASRTVAILGAVPLDPTATPARRGTIGAP